MSEHKRQLSIVKIFDCREYLIFVFHESGQLDLLQTLAL